MNQAESLFAPITREAILLAKAHLALRDESAAQWAARNGYKAKIVYQVLSGARRCIRGQSLQIAIKLGLRPDPTAPAVDHSLTPAGRNQASRRGDASGQSIAGGRPAASCGRPSNLQLGEAAR